AAPLEQRAVLASLAPPSFAASARYTLHTGVVQPVEQTALATLALPPPAEGWDADVDAPPLDRCLVLDGERAAASVAPAPELDPAGACTLECWAWSAGARGRTGLVAKTESSAYGFFLERAGRPAPSWHVFLAGSGYATARGGERDLPLRRWTHVAGTFDGRDV